MQGAALPSNTWWGVSISCQADADAMIPPLLSCPVEHRWLSIEPMVGSVDASAFLSHGGEAGHTLHPEPCTLNPKKWVVCGGESGPGARPMHPDWPRSLRDQCQAAGVPFFFKQWGEWVDYWEQCEGYREDDYELPSDRPVAWWDPHGIPVSDPPEVLSHAEFERYQAVDRVGKKAAGRLLDGREHTEVPW
jgi:protein gp37